MAKAHLIHSELFARFGVQGMFTLRHGGISPPPFESWNFGSGIGDDEHHIHRNIGLLLAESELDAAPHRIHQIHGTDAHFFEGFGHDHQLEGDILISITPGTAVAVRTADCLPLLLADPSAGVVAAVHAGWRGTAEQVAIKAVEIMKSHGAKTEHIIASLGPCIGPCCFEIGEEPAELLSNSCKQGNTMIHRTDRIHADLAGLNRLQLLQLGIKADHIESSALCTACDAEQFFSYRRDQGKTGRHLAVVALPINT